MKSIRRYMHRRERHFAMLNDNRVVRPFAWGTEFVGENLNGTDPRLIFKRFSEASVANSESFFALSEPPVVAGGLPKLIWPSAITTPFAENNTARATFFPFKKNKRVAVVILPHWNARGGSYFNLCRTFNRFGMSALRLTMPYHEERKPPELVRADHLVSQNVGLTLQAMRQAVIDTKSAVGWLKSEGYEKVGIVGTSIGSCIAFLAFVHEPEIDAAVFNHVSGYFADVVWHGLSTYHVREALEKEVSLEELRKFWLPISPMAYIEKLAVQPARPQRFIYTLYDLTFPIELSRETMKALRDHGISHSESVIPCGHYTLGKRPWVYLDGYKIVSFLRKHLRQKHEQ